MTHKLWFRIAGHGFWVSACGRRFPNGKKAWRKPACRSCRRWVAKGGRP